MWLGLRFDVTLHVSGYLRLGKLTESDQQLLERCAEQVQVAHEPVRLWIQELCAWVEEAGRKPLRMSADANERSQALRWNNARRPSAIQKLALCSSMFPNPE